MKKIITLILLPLMLFFGSKIFSQVTYPCGVYFLSLNGTSDYGAWDKIYPTGDYTLAAWVQTRDAVWQGKEMNIFQREVRGLGDDDGLNLYISTNGEFKFSAYTFKNGVPTLDSLSSGVKPEPLKWYHVAVTFKSTGECNIYIDGNLTSSKAFGGGMSLNFPYLNYLVVGRKYSYLGSNAYGSITFKGYLDELAVASKAFTQDQIKTLANGLQKGDPFLTANNVESYDKEDTYPGRVNSGIGGGSIAINGQLTYCQYNLPVANAGPDQTITLPVNTVTLNGSATPGTGTVTGGVWSKVSGPAGGDISDITSQTPVVSNLKEGIYVFRLTVTDVNAKTGTDDVTITVKPKVDMPITGLVNNVSCNTASGIPENGVLAPTFQKSPMISNVIIRLLENGVEKEKTVVDATGKFKLTNAEEGKSYNIEIMHTNGIAYDIKYVYQNVKSNTDLGEILIPIGLIAEIIKFMPGMQNRHFNYKFLEIEIPSLDVDVKGFNTSGYEDVFNPFYIGDLNGNHKKNVDNLANFYASIVAVYALGGIKSDMDNVTRSTVLDCIQNCFAYVEWFDVLKRIFKMNIIPPTKQDLVRKMVVNSIKFAFEKIKSNLKSSITTLGTFFPEKKQKFEEYLSVVNDATGIALDIIESPADGTAKGLLDFAKKKLALNLIANDYLDYCQTQHKNFISSASISSQHTESNLEYAVIYNNLLNKGSESLYKQAKDILESKKSDAELWISASKYLDATKGIFDAATKLALIFGQVEIAPITKLLENISKVAQTASIFRAFTISSQGSSAIGDLSDQILPDAGFSLHRNAPANYNTIRTHSTLSQESLMLQKNNYNQKLIALKTVFNSPYDSAAYYSKISEFNKEDSLYTEEMTKSLNSLWASGDSASIKIPGFSNSLQTTIDRFVTRQYTLRQAFFFQNLSYWFDSTKTGYVSELNMLADSIILLNNGAVDSLTKLFDDISSNGIIAPASLVQDDYQITHDHEPGSSGSFSYTFKNYGSLVQKNVSFKMGALTGGFHVTGADSIFVGNIQAGESKTITFSFSSPMTDTLGGYEIEVHTDNGSYNNTTGSLYVSKTTDSTYSIKDGNWEQSATWSRSKVPAAATNASVLHAVTINSNAAVKNLKIEELGSITVKDSASLSIKGNLQIIKRKIGDVYQGGIIFYLDSNNHGLVCSTEDIGIYPWDLTVFDPQNFQNYNPPLVNASGIIYGSGYTNTTKAVNLLGSGNYAASKCRSYNGGGYTDWYLPSKDELNLMYTNLKINGVTNFSSTNSSYYWSSSEIDNKNVWTQKFDDGIQSNGTWKNNNANVRAIRSF